MKNLEKSIETEKSSKVCIKCGKEKEYKYFYKASTTKDRFDVYCKICRKSKSKSFFQDNEGYMNNYVSENYDVLSEYYSKRYYDNRETILPQRKEYAKNNRHIINKNNRKRYHTDILYKLKDLIKSSINKSIKSKGYTKRSKTYIILGCTFEELFIYLESKFESWMTWDNHGLYNGNFNFGWDIDHIIPISSAKTEEDVIRLNHYTNLQPLCSHINRDIKINKLNYEIKR